VATRDVTFDETARYDPIEPQEAEEKAIRALEASSRTNNWQIEEQDAEDVIVLEVPGYVIEEREQSIEPPSRPQVSTKTRIPQLTMPLPTPRATPDAESNESNASNASNDLNDRTEPLATESGPKEQAPLSSPGQTPAIVNPRHKRARQNRRYGSVSYSPV
jgi:hypothetical protein